MRARGSILAMVGLGLETKEERKKRKKEIHTHSKWEHGGGGERGKDTYNLILGELLDQ